MPRLVSGRPGQRAVLAEQVGPVVLADRPGPDSRPGRTRSWVSTRTAMAASRATNFPNKCMPCSSVSI